MERWWWEREDPTASRGGQATIFAVFLLSGCHSQAHGFFGLAVAEQGCCMHACASRGGPLFQPKGKAGQDGFTKSIKTGRPTDRPTYLYRQLQLPLEEGGQMRLSRSSFAAHGHLDGRTIAPMVQRRRHEIACSRHQSQTEVTLARKTPASAQRYAGKLAVRSNNGRLSLTPRSESRVPLSAPQFSRF